MQPDNFIIIYGWMLQRGLSSSEVLVLAAISTLNAGGAKALSNGAIAEWSGVNERTVTRAIQSLSEAGLLSVDANRHFCITTKCPPTTDCQATDCPPTTNCLPGDDKLSASPRQNVYLPTTDCPAYNSNNKNNNSNSGSAHTQAESFVQNGVQAQADLSYPSLQQLLAYADSQHIDPELAQAWFRKMTASGWRMSHGDPVKNWQRCLDYYIRNGLIKRPRPAVASEGKRIGELLSASRPGPITDDPESPNYCNTPGVYLLPNQIAAEQKEEADRRQAEEDKKAPDYEDHIDSIVRRHTHGHASLNAGTQAQKE